MHVMGCNAALASKVPFYVAREIRQKDDGGGGQPIKESVCNAVGGLVYKTEKAALNKAVKAAIHEAVRSVALLYNYWFSMKQES